MRKIAKYRQNQNVLFSVDSRYACADTVKTSDDNQAEDKCDY